MKTRRRVLGLLLVGVLLGADRAAAQRAKPYTDLILGYQFVPPPGWQLIEAKDKVGQVSLSNPASKAFILLSVESNPKQIDDGKPATQAQLQQLGLAFKQRFERGQLGKVYKRFNLLSSGPGQMAGFNTAQLLFQGVPADAKVGEGRVYVQIGGDQGRLVTLMFVSPEPAFENLRPAIATVVRSFRLN